MRAVKSLPQRKTSKLEREREVLFKLVSSYIQSGKPVGSVTLQESEFHALSSATIRNYFASLELAGYLTQQHISGGRIPTAKAYREYASQFVKESPLPKHALDRLGMLHDVETHEIAAFMQESVEILSELTNCAVFISSPRFDHDFVVDLRLVSVDAKRCVCILITDFGVIRSEVMAVDRKLSALAVKRIEQYFHWRLTGQGRPEGMDEDEEAIAQNLYNELMIRFLINYTNYYDEDVYKTGFSRLLNYQELQHPTNLADSLSLFENGAALRLILRECKGHGHLKYWIGNDLAAYTGRSEECAVAGVPYLVNQQPVGAVGVLGPSRIPYPELFAILRSFSACISTVLTKSVYKFKITYRQPKSPRLELPSHVETKLLLEKK